MQLIINKWAIRTYFVNTSMLLKEYFAWHLKWSERSNECVMRGKHSRETEKTKYLGIAKIAFFFW